MIASSRAIPRAAAALIGTTRLVPGPVGGGASDTSVASASSGVSASVPMAIGIGAPSDAGSSTFVSSTSHGTFLQRVTSRVVVSSTGSK